MDSLQQSVAEEARRAQIREKLRQIVERRELPVLPVVVTRVLGMLNDPDLSIRALSRILSDDPVLAARILAAARSAYYGQRTLPTTLQAAIQVMGLRDLRNVMISVVSHGLFKSNSPVADTLWSHSLGVALGCRILTSYLRQRDSEQAFLAGLLHDVGQVILLHYDREGFLQVIREACKHKSSMAVKEREHYGFDHAWIGASLLESWNMDAEICKAAHAHHNAEEIANTGSLSAMLIMADYLASQAGLGFYTPVHTPPPELLRAFACDSDAVLAQAVEEIRQAFVSENVLLSAT